MKKRKQKEMLGIFGIMPSRGMFGAAIKKIRMIDIILFFVVDFSWKYDKWLLHMPTITRQVGCSCLFVFIGSKLGYKIDV